MNSQDTSAKISTCFLKRYGFLFSVICSAFILFTGCEKDHADGTDITVLESASEDIIASKGGTISTESGVKLYIPPSALSGDTTITIEKLLVSTDKPWEFLAIVRISPSGLDLLSEATLTIPVEGDFDYKEEAELLNFYGENPGYCIQTGEYAPIIEGYSKHASAKSDQGNNKVQLKIGTTANKVVTRNCHGGTIKNINNMFMNRGCTQTNLVQQMNTVDPSLKITEKTLEFAIPPQVKAVLKTYHEKKYSFKAGQDVPSDVIDKIEEHTKNGYSVVIEYGKSSGDECKHTSTIVIKNGKPFIRNTCKVGKDIQEAYGNEIIYEHELNDINNFRKTNPVNMLEKGLGLQPGDLADPAKNKTGQVVIPMDVRPDNKPWESINIHFEKAPSGSSPKSTGDAGNPCEYWEISRMWCAWYVENISLQPVRVTTHVDFDKDELCKNYPGGGMDPDLLMEKVMMTGMHDIKEEAISAACEMFDTVYRLPGSSTFIWTTYLGWIGDVRHDCDELGGCGAK
ncbi:MAG: hypothetical protein JW723_14965 [Bacteroidales bacterium]|nr:hypothetical protein [Bacteroidales bacterium]